MDIGAKFGDFLKQASGIFNPANYHFQFGQPSGQVQAKESKVFGNPQAMKLTVTTNGVDGRPAPFSTTTPSPLALPTSAPANRTMAPSATTHPLAVGAPPQPAATSSPYKFGQNISKQEVERKLKAGFQEYSHGKGVPMEAHIPQLVAGAEKYPGLQNNPFLTAAVSLNETSGGQNWTNLKNPVSWGARIKDIYQPSSADQALEDMMSAVGGDPNRGQGFDPQTAQTRMQTAAAYQPFRDSNNLQDFSFRYESPNNNPDYYKNLIQFIQMFERQ